jgi:hypothetical protein
MVLYPDRIFFERTLRIEVIVIVVIRGARFMGMTDFPPERMVLQRMSAPDRRVWLTGHFGIPPSMPDTTQASRKAT